MAKQPASGEFSHEAIRRQLQEQGASGEPVSAQVFFGDDVDASALGSVAEAVVKEAEESVGRPRSVEVRKVRGLAKSASVSGDPEVIAAMQASEKVKAVLPNVVQDILPQPRGKREIQ